MFAQEHRKMLCQSENYYSKTMYMENIMNSDDDEKGTNMVLLSGLKKF